MFFVSNQTPIKKLIATAKKIAPQKKNTTSKKLEPTDADVYLLLMYLNGKLARNQLCHTLKFNQNGNQFEMWVRRTIEYAYKNEILTFNF